jgi:ketosteroid isomerase-like protein
MKIQHGSAVRTARLLGLAVTPLLLAAIHTDAHAMSSMASQSLQSDVADTATDVVNAFHAALKRGDATAALNLMAEDVVIFESGGVERNRAEYATHHLKSDAAFSAATTRTPISQTIASDGNLSSVMSVEFVKGTFRDRPVNSRSVETMVLRKTEGRWRIIHIHWSSANIQSK